MNSLGCRGRRLPKAPAEAPRADLITKGSSFDFCPSLNLAKTPIWYIPKNNSLIYEFRKGKIYNSYNDMYQTNMILKYEKKILWILKFHKIEAVIWQLFQAIWKVEKCHSLKLVIKLLFANYFSCHITMWNFIF